MMGAHVHMLAQLSDLSSLKCWATNFVKYNLSCWLRIGSYIIIGGSAHPVNRYVSWVQNDVNQFGLYL